MKSEGLYTVLEQTDTGLNITLTELGRSELESYVVKSEKDVIVFNRSHEHILFAMLEDHLASGVRDLLEPWQLGALTSSPIIAYGADIPDDGFMKDAEAVYWFPNYAVESEIETLLRNGVVTFERVSEGVPIDPPQKFKCEMCGAELEDVDSAMDHKCGARSA
jgi:hypothetical protein